MAFEEQDVHGLWVAARVFYVEKRDGGRQDGTNCADSARGDKEIRIRRRKSRSADRKNDVNAADQRNLKERQAGVTVP